MPLIAFTKTATTYVDQLQQLKNRGLIVDSDKKALHLLETLNYFRLSGYWYPLLAEPKEDHIFKPNSTFQTAFKLYRFDRDLRIFILKELEKVEIAIRAQMIYSLSHLKDPFWYTDSASFSNAYHHSKSLGFILRDVDKSDEEFIKAFKKKYSNPLPPCWMALEIVSFGTLSQLYGNLNFGKRDIANHFGLDDTTFTSWLHTLVYIRNICAHHARLWNRGMSIKPKKPLTPSKMWLKDTSVKNNRTYFVLCMLLYLLQSIDKKHQFIFRCKLLLKKYPNIDVAAMGFPKNWENEPLWKFKPTIKQRIRLLVCIALK